MPVTPTCCPTCTCSSRAEPGGAVDWLARQLAGPGAADLYYEALEAAAAQGVGRRAGPVWLPHLHGGSGTPEGDLASLAALVGVRSDHEPGDLFRGLLESLAFWLRHNVEVMAALTGQTATDVILTGGTTRLHLLSQLKADVLDRPMIVSDVPEAAACRALLAGLGAGVRSRGSGRQCSTAAPDRAAAEARDVVRHTLPRYLPAALRRPARRQPQAG